MYFGTHLWGGVIGASSCYPSLIRLQKKSHSLEHLLSDMVYINNHACMSRAHKHARNIIRSPLYSSDRNRKSPLRRMSLFGPSTREGKRHQMEAFAYFLSGVFLSIIRCDTYTCHYGRARVTRLKKKRGVV